jgi:16S rRNA processing protein RimM
MTTPRMVRVAQFGAAHGIRGEVRLKSFTQNPEDVAAYGPLTAADGRVFEIETLRPAAGSSSPDMFVVRLKGIRDRNAAEKLTRLDLSVPADRLPAKEEGEFFHADLIGLTAVTPAGAEVGTVIAIPNYGAGDLLEIAPPRGQTLLVPFTDSAVPEVDLAGGRIVVVPPKFSDDAGGDADDSDGDADGDEGGRDEGEAAS